MEGIDLGGYAFQSLVYTTIYVFFVLYTFKNKLKYSFRKSMLIGICCNMLYTLFLLLCSMKHIHIGGPALILWFCGLFLFGILTIRCNLLHLIYFLVVIFNIHYNVLLIAGLACMLYMHPIPMAQQDLRFIAMTGIIFLAFLPFTCYLFLILFKKVIDIDINFTNSKFLLILPISCFIYTWLSKHSYIPVSDSYSGKSVSMLILSNVCEFLAYAAVLQMIIKTHDSKQAAERANLARQIIIMQKERYAELSSYVEKTAHFQHDLRHHFIAIRGYVKSEDLQGLNAYLECYQSESIITDENPICENHLVDVILRHYIAGAKDVRIEISVSVPESFGFPNTELSSVFGNLIENAVEACERQKNQNKFIDIHTKPISKSMLAITVKNSYDDDIQKKGEIFLSSKRKGVGIGISSIQAIAEKNGGSCSFSFTGNVFCAHVLLIS